jgi:hypothetical protein
MGANPALIVSAGRAEIDVLENVERVQPLKRSTLEGFNP